MAGRIAESGLSSLPWSAYSLNDMGITKILVAYDVRIGALPYDVLLPLPANADACLAGLGITDFADADARWDADFQTLLQTLMPGNCAISTRDPTMGSEELIRGARFADIPGYLAYDDAQHLILSSGTKAVTFTRGHEILWLTGYAQEEIESIPFTLEAMNTDRIRELF